MSVLSARDIVRSYGSNTILENASFQLADAERVGIVGPNGGGKTTLLRLLAGADEPDVGEIARSREAKIGWLPQHSNFEPGPTVVDQVIAARGEVAELEAKMRDLEEKMAEEADADTLQRLVDRHGRMQEEYERAGAYELRPRAEELLAGLGVAQAFFDRDASSLSGGEAGRVALARVLLNDPDVLVLDEPTNHLDLAGCEWLEGYIERYRGAVIVVSHDRYLLDRVTQRTVEVRDGSVRSFKGAYSKFERLKAEGRERRQVEWEAQQSQIRKEREFIRKHKGSQRTKEAKGREKRLDNMDRLEAPTTEAGSMTLRLDPKRRLGQRVIELRDVAAGYDGRTLFAGLELDIVPGERLGIVGPNGTGKSTLLSIMGGRRAADEGKVAVGETVDLGYYDQHQLDLDPEATPFGVVAGTDLSVTEGQVKTYLARFHLTGDMVDRRCGDLSGGERVRVALARLLLSRPNVVLLDEPTNHLDIGSRGAVEEMIRAYTGTVVTVSHDRYFLDRLCTRILWIEDGEIRLHTGGYTDARNARSRERSEALAAQAATKAAKAKHAKTRDKPRPERKKKRRSSETVESDIMEREEEKERLLEEMATPEVYSDVEETRTREARLKEIDVELAELETEWDDVTES